MFCAATSVGVSSPKSGSSGNIYPNKLGWFRSVAVKVDAIDDKGVKNWPLLTNASTEFVYPVFGINCIHFHASADVRNVKSFVNSGCGGRDASNPMS